VLAAKQNRPVQQGIELINGLTLEKTSGSGETD
jgi:hypothetical protein